MKRHFTMLAAVVAVCLLASLAVSIDTRPGGVHFLVKRWWPRVFPVNRRVEVPIDTSLLNASYQDIVFVRASTFLDLTTTPAEDDQILHPNVKYIEGGFNGYNWVLVGTPFPATNPTRFENPEIFYSVDGRTSWVASTGNPIDTWPGGNEFNSDPHLYFDGNGDGTGTLYCFYLWTDAVSEHDLLCRTTTDGDTWSDAIVVIEGATFSTIIAPSIVNRNGTYWMWTTDTTGTDNLTYRTSKSLTSGWSDPTDCVITGMEATRTPWHVEVSQFGDLLGLVGTFKESFDFYVGTSVDGVNFDVQLVFDPPGDDSAWDTTLTYNASAVWHPETMSADVFYGGTPATTHYRIGRGKLFFLPNPLYDRKPLNNMLAILGDCRGFWPVFESNGTTIADYSRYGNDLTASADIGLFDVAPVLRGPAHVLQLNETDEGASRADDADFTFISGGNDVAFSCGAWIYMNEGIDREIMGKWNSAASTIEWRLYLDSAEKLLFACYDNSEGTTASEGRLASAGLAKDRWYFVVATRDATQGESASDGFNVYSVDATTDTLVSASAASDGAGAYTDMEDTAAALTLGYTMGGGGATSWFSDKIALPFVCAKELTADEVMVLYHHGKCLLGLMIFSPSVLVARRRQFRSVVKRVRNIWRQAA